jgi:hypothetical protein
MGRLGVLGRRGFRASRLGVSRLRMSRLRMSRLGVSRLGVSRLRMSRRRRRRFRASRLRVRGLRATRLGRGGLGDPLRVPHRDCGVGRGGLFRVHRASCALRTSPRRA